MNYKMMGRFIGKILMVEAAFMVPAMLLSLYEGEFASVRAFMWTLAVIVLVAGLLMCLCRGSQNKFYAKEGLACVGISWIVMSLLGCLPFFISPCRIHVESLEGLKMSTWMRQGVLM